MKLKATPLILVFIWCIFMGITVGSIGIGAVIPSVNLIAKPFVCPRGEMTLTTQKYTPTPVETVTTLTWYCVDSQTGEQTELGIFPMSLYAGTIYGLLFFVVVCVGMFINSRRSSSEPQAQDSFTGIHDDGIVKLSHKARVSADTFEKMQELKKLHDANLITEEEYQQKRSEILSDL